MVWLEDYYVSENLKGKKKILQWCLKKGVFVRPLYYIVLSKYKDGQLEIIAANRSPYGRRMEKEYEVIGVAKGYYHARTLVTKILLDVYEKQKSYDCKSYFQPLFRQRREGES